MSTASTPSAFGDGVFQVKPRNSQLQHRHYHSRAQTAIISSLLGEDACSRGLLQHHHCRVVQVPTGSYHRARHGLHSRNAAAPSYMSSVTALVWNGGPSHCEKEQNLCLIQPFPCFTSFGSLLQRRHCRISAHSEQHLSLQEDKQRLLRSQERREALQKYKTSVLASIAQQQASLQQSALLSTDLQTEGILGYTPVGYDVSCCRIVFVANLHKRVSKTFLMEVFSTVGPIVAHRLIQKAKSSYGFVEYQNHHAAATAISSLNGMKLFGLPIVVNWAFPGDSVKDTTEHHKIFVGNLSANVTEVVLSKAFKKYPTCSVVRVVWDTSRGRSKGYGFVSFRDKEDATKAIAEMAGTIIGDKAIKCGWAVFRETTTEQARGKNTKEVFKIMKEDPHYTTVFVGNLANEVSEDKLREVFSELRVGVIQDVHIGRSKGHGFVKFSTHEEAAQAIQAADGIIIGERPVKCWWGTKPSTQSALSDPQLLESQQADESSDASASLPVEELALAEK